MHTYSIWKTIHIEYVRPIGIGLNGSIVTAITITNRIVSDRDDRI